MTPAAFALVAVAAATPEIRSLPPAGTLRRWVVVHERDPDGLVHVEVLGRRADDPAGRVERLADHMALTPDALRASVGARLARGAVYPERYDAAVARWRTARRDGGGAVCSTTVVRCLEGGGGPSRDAR